MAGQQAQVAVAPALGERDAHAGRRGRCGRQPGGDVIGNARGFQRLGFLVEPPEDAGIARLEPHDAGSAQRVLDDEGVDLVLLHRGAEAALADRHEPCAVAGHGEDVGGHQRVVQDHVGTFHHPNRPHGEKLGVAGTGADEGHMALAQEDGGSCHWGQLRCG